MRSTGEVLGDISLFKPISQVQKTCNIHGIEYLEIVYPRYKTICPECRKDKEREREMAEKAAAETVQKQAHMARIDERMGYSRIPPRYQHKTVKAYQVDASNTQQIRNVEAVKDYAYEFTRGTHSGRNLAMLGNAGTGKTHLACAIGNHVIRNCGGQARFSSVAEINRLVREAKSYSSTVSESEVIEAFSAYDLLIIDEVGVQSGTEAESRALFDVFNERYQNLKPTILISNLDAADFVAAVGNRIADRIKEDGGEFLFFNWESAR
ncbi:ATP-binding protein [Kingella negevensis]|uniref:ATP-binding protein n=1 Tax=Kingella negevensis TaxID=1522312 RepID=UPI0025515209|nr:ATP-binding protein [Kingella negevensis]MDK4689672.1 ATP-binding protein [Kingella negevensis]